MRRERGPGGGWPGRGRLAAAVGGLVAAGCAVVLVVSQLGGGTGGRPGDPAGGGEHGGRGARGADGGDGAACGQRVAGGAGAVRPAAVIGYRNVQGGGLEPGAGVRVIGYR